MWSKTLKKIGIIIGEKGAVFGKMLRWTGVNGVKIRKMCNWETV